MHAAASHTRVLPIHQVMPVLYVLDNSSLQLLAREDVLDAYTFDLHIILMPKISCLQIP